MNVLGLNGVHNTKAESVNRASVDTEKREIWEASQPSVSAKLSSILLVWSSADKDGIYRWCETYKDFLSNRPEAAPSWDHYFYQNLAFTLAYRRSMLSWRAYAVLGPTCRSDQLETVMSRPQQSSATTPHIAFIFTGQGSQYPRMASELISYPVFRISLQDATRFLKSLGCTWSALDELFKDEDKSNIDSPDYCQPLCTALQVAIVDLLRSFAVKPSVVVGHSSGEIAAA